MDINWNSFDDEVDEPDPQSQSSMIPGEDWESSDEDGYQRRFRGKQREARKRQREDYRLDRDDMEAMASREQKGPGKRAKEKRAKQGLQQLQQIAKRLDLKRLMQTVNQSAQCNCWGPEVASDKKAPNLGLYVNYLEPNTTEASPRQPSRRFGIWLFYRNQRVHIAVGEQGPVEEGEQWQTSTPPPPNERLLSIEYKSADQAAIKSQIEAAVLTWQHLPG